MADLTALRARLVAQLRADGALVDDTIADAFLAVARERFIPEIPADEAYLDRAVVTRWQDGVPVSSSSQPAIMAIMLEQLAVQPGDRVLEIGAGTGYNAALLSLLVGAGGRVTSVELDDATAAGARRHLASAGVSGVTVLTGDGLVGAPAGAPYDRLIVTASAREIPGAWIAQLRPGGRLVVPFRLNGVQVVLALDRRGDDLVTVSAAGGGFMPLRSRSLEPLVAELPDGSLASADVPLDDALLASFTEHAAEARPVALPLPDGALEAHAAFVFLALQGAPIYSIDRRPRDASPRTSHVLITSPRSALRWARVPSERDPEALGSDEALDFVRAALTRWRLAGQPGVEALRMHVTPARGLGALGPLPRPIAGAYRFARGEHAYEVTFGG